MKYYQKLTLNDGRECILRNGDARDGKSALADFIKAHSETDNLLSYPDEITFTAEQEAAFLQAKADSGNEVEILAEVDGQVVGTAGIESLGNKAKLRHRCDFGISVEKAYWGYGIGRALTDACIACAKEAGYEQMELQVVAENDRAVRMYEKAGFVEFGRNPRGFKSRRTGYQEVVYMRIELILSSNKTL